MADSDLMQLYSRRILALTTAIPHLGTLPAFDGNHVVLGAWVVENESAGLGIRESAGLVTDEYARFRAGDWDDIPGAQVAVAST